MFKCQLSTAQREEGGERDTSLRVKEEECLCVSVSRPLPRERERERDTLLRVKEEKCLCLSVSRPLPRERERERETRYCGLRSRNAFVSVSAVHCPTERQRGWERESHVIEG